MALTATTYAETRFHQALAAERLVAVLAGGDGVLVCVGEALHTTIPAKDDLPLHIESRPIHPVDHTECSISNELRAARLNTLAVNLTTPVLHLIRVTPNGMRPNSIAGACKLLPISRLRLYGKAPSIGTRLAKEIQRTKPSTLSESNSQKEITMWKTMTVALTILLGTMVTASAAAYHVIRTEEGCLVIAKEQCYLGDAYVDVRNWDEAEWEKRPALVSSILRVR